MTQTKGQGAGNLFENIPENLEDLRLTVKEAAKYVNESPGVVRNWLRELKSYIPTMQGDNGYHYFDQRALERLMLIRQLNRD
ncbi:MerR family transcriptional regulator [Domibacillus iocasae]|uniref:MerR family transcriptional regulator n=1 Tax=Domibacillus iocasae TaxID=1714016 RepID=UPI001471BD5F|nr:MerR family transcriptional regulator [Domibacillus iocasae]